MSKFKQGDRVKIISETYENGTKCLDQSRVGKLGTIEDIVTNNLKTCYLVLIEGTNTVYIYFEENLELAGKPEINNIKELNKALETLGVIHPIKGNSMSSDIRTFIKEMGSSGGCSGLLSAQIQAQPSLEDQLKEAEEKVAKIKAEIDKQPKKYTVECYTSRFQARDSYNVLGVPQLVLVRTEWNNIKLRITVEEIRE